MYANIEHIEENIGNEVSENTAYYHRNNYLGYVVAMEHSQEIIPGHEAENCNNQLCKKNKEAADRADHDKVCWIMS